MKILKTAAAVGAAALLALPAIGHATLVSSGSNDPLNFSWAYNTGSSTLTGSGSMTISGFNSSALTVAVSLSNTSAGGQGGERLTAFGFGIDPNATSVSFTDGNAGGLINAVMGQTFPGGYKAVDICAIGGATCAGGGNGGVFGGTSDSFTITLGGNWGSSVNIDPIALKYQTGYGSFEFSPSTGSLPEPSSMAVAGLGFGLLGAFLLRRRSFKVSLPTFAPMAPLAA